MTIKVRELTNDDGWLVWCPACDNAHVFFRTMPDGSVGWTFNGDIERPTFSPSLKRTSPGHCCHAILADGVWNYCSDSTHAMAGQSVPVPDWPRPVYGGMKP